MPAKCNMNKLTMHTNCDTYAHRHQRMVPHVIKKPHHPRTDPLANIYVSTTVGPHVKIVDRSSDNIPAEDGLSEM